MNKLILKIKKYFLYTIMTLLSLMLLISVLGIFGWICYNNEVTHECVADNEKGKYILFSTLLIIIIHFCNKKLKNIKSKEANIYNFENNNELFVKIKPHLLNLILTSSVGILSSIVENRPLYVYIILFFIIEVIIIIIQSKNKISSKINYYKIKKYDLAYYCDKCLKMYPLSHKSTCDICGSFMKVQSPEYIEKDVLTKFINNNKDDKTNLKINESVEENDYEDPLYNEIVEFAINTGKISASLLKRRFRLGYNRAARCIDLLEKRGIIGPANGSAPREVLVKLDKEKNQK